MFNVPIGNHVFDLDQINRIVANTIPNIPAGKTGAAVAAIDRDGAKVVIELAQNADNHWSAELAYAHDWDGDDHIGGRVMFSW